MSISMMSRLTKVENSSAFVDEVKAQLEALATGICVELGSGWTVKAIRLGFDNKGEQPRLVPLTDRVVAILKTRREARQDGEKRVWPDMTVDRAEYFWKLVREKLKLTKAEDPDFVIHACRHTFASRLAMQGVPLNVIKELGGWRTLEMVLRYAHLTPQVKEDAIRKMQSWGKTGTNG